jgi:hypothetical protein
MENVKLFVTGNTDISNENLTAIFKKEFEEPIAEICKDIVVLFYQRDRTPKNRYNARVYCDSQDKYIKIIKLISEINHGFDIQVDPFVT